MKRNDLIRCSDYSRALYSAYWEIVVQGETDDPNTPHRFHAKLISYEPIGWLWQGKVTQDRPRVPEPVYPADIPVRQHEYERMGADEQRKVREMQEARRAECSRIYESHPKAVTQIDEYIGVGNTRDQALDLAQKWVLSEMPKYRRKGAVLHSIAIAPPLDLVGEMLGALWRGVRDLILMALAYSTTLRNNRMNQVRDAIDGGAGAGLWRIYDGTRPATCGTATTLLAELTCSDPCAAAAASGVMTFSSITADSSANATGTATWFRIVDSAGTCCVDGAVGTAGSDLNLNSTSISTGQQVSITSATITEGNA